MFKESSEAGSVFNKDAGYRPTILAKDELPKSYILKIPNIRTKKLHCRKGYSRTHVSVTYLSINVSSDK